MQILIPIAARTKFFPENEFYFPKPLIEVFNEPLIKVVVENLRKRFIDSEFIFVVDRLESRKFSLTNTLKLITGDKTKVFERPTDTAGALCSCLLSVDLLNYNAPLMIANSDMIINTRLDEAVNYFKTNKVDAGVMTFDSIHPRWSYVRPRDEVNIAQIYEKEVISNNAVAGLYYFKTASLFIESAKKVILNNITNDGMYYISSTINECILSGLKAHYLKVPNSSVISFHSPASIDDYVRSNSRNDKNK